MLTIPDLGAYSGLSWITRLLMHQKDKDLDTMRAPEGQVSEFCNIQALASQVHSVDLFSGRDS